MGFIIEKQEQIKRYFLEKISERGQGFAYEIFVVFQNAHKNVKIVPVNM